MTVPRPAWLQEYLNDPEVSNWMAIEWVAELLEAMANDMEAWEVTYPYVSADTQELLERYAAGPYPKGVAP